MTLRAGTVDISPADRLALFGRQGPARQYTSRSSKLEANIVIDHSGDQPLILICLDTLYPSAVLLDIVHRHVQAQGIVLSKDAILMVASHTHNAPALDPTKPLLGPLSQSYLDLVGQQIADRIGKLMQANESPAVVLTGGQALCTNSVFRRKNALGLSLRPFGVMRRLVMAPVPRQKIDQRLRLFVWRDSNDTPVAALWHWACHAVSEPEKLAISADFPGLVRAHLRQVLGDAELPVMYLPGFSADIRPKSFARLPLLRAGKWVGIGLRFARNTAKRQAKLVNGLTQAMDHAYQALKPLATDVPAAIAQNTIPLNDLRDEVAPDSAPVTVAHWSFLGLKITAVGGEVSHEYGTVGDLAALETGCAQQVFGYLPTDTQIHEGGYEADGFAPAFSVPGHFHTQIETHIRRAIRWP